MYPTERGLPCGSVSPHLRPPISVLCNLCVVLYCTASSCRVSGWQELSWGRALWGWVMLNLLTTPKHKGSGPRWALRGRMWVAGPTQRKLGLGGSAHLQTRLRLSGKGEEDRTGEPSAGMARRSGLGFRDTSSAVGSRGLGCSRR